MREEKEKKRKKREKRVEEDIMKKKQRIHQKNKIIKKNK